MEGSNKKMVDGNNGGEIMTADKRNQKTEAWRKEKAIFFLGIQIEHRGNELNVCGNRKSSIRGKKIKRKNEIKRNK